MGAVFLVMGFICIFMFVFGVAWLLYTVFRFLYGEDDGNPRG